MASVLATKYARALLDLLAQAPEAELEDTARQVRVFRDVYASSHELQSALLEKAQGWLKPGRTVRRGSIWR